MLLDPGLSLSPGDVSSQRKVELIFEECQVTADHSSRVVVTSVITRSPLHHYQPPAGVAAQHLLTEILISHWSIVVT